MLVTIGHGDQRIKHGLDRFYFIREHPAIGIGGRILLRSANAMTLAIESGATADSPFASPSMTYSVPVIEAARGEATRGDQVQSRRAAQCRTRSRPQPYGGYPRPERTPARAPAS